MFPAEVDHALTLDVSDAVTMLGGLRESQYFERKSGRTPAKALAKPLVAFANADGGDIFLGYHDGSADPVPIDSVNEIRQAAMDFTRPPVRVEVRELRDGESGGVFMLLRVSPGETVHETQSKDCFVRVGDESRKLDFEQRKELVYDRGSAPFDGHAIGASPEELDENLTDEYRSAIGSSDLRSMLRARSLLTPPGDLTVAGYLLFFRRPQELFPNAYVRILRYGDVERGTGARLSLIEGQDVACEGSIPQQIHRASEVIEDMLPRRRMLTPSGVFEPRTTIPRDAWLEGLVNAVVHRSYSATGDHVRVEIFPDRIEITSPGRFPGLANPTDPLSISRHARNPRIARVCADLGIAQELGEGIKRIFDEMRRRGLTDPLYKQTPDAVRLVLSSADAVSAELRKSLTPSAMRILDVMRNASRPLGTGQIAREADVARLTAKRNLEALRDSQLVRWEGTSARDPRAVWHLL